MGKYLTGSAQTGTKIIKNIDLFKYNFVKKETFGDAIIYHFDWRFDTSQFGHIGIEVKNQKISNSSLIATDNRSPHGFNPSLGLYNDSSLEQVFSMMMRSIGITITGVYSDPF